MQPKMMARHTRALSCVFPGGQTQKTDLRMSSSVSCEYHSQLMQGQTQKMDLRMSSSVSCEHHFQIMQGQGLRCSLCTAKGAVASCPARQDQPEFVMGRIARIVLTASGTDLGAAQAQVRACQPVLLPVVHELLAYPVPVVCHQGLAIL